MRESVQLSVEHLGVVMTGRKTEDRVGGNVQPSLEKPTEILNYEVSYLKMWFSSRKEK